jgi:hypothetical protein
MEMLFDDVSLLPQLMLNSSDEKPHEPDPTSLNLPTPLFYGRPEDGDFEISKFMKSFVSQDFALFVAAYYMHYLYMAGIVTAVAVFTFKIDYSNIDSKQLKSERRSWRLNPTLLVPCCLSGSCCNVYPRGTTTLTGSELLHPTT